MEERPKPDGITVLGHTLDKRKPLASYLVFPCRVTALEVKGNDRTRREVVEREMRSALGATNHHQLAVELAEASFRLEESFKVRCAPRTPASTPRPISLESQAPCLPAEMEMIASCPHPASGGAGDVTHGGGIGRCVRGGLRGHERGWWCGRRGEDCRARPGEIPASSRLRRQPLVENDGMLLGGAGVLGS
jgi:hypothetical protein